MKKHITVNTTGPYHILKGIPCQDSVYLKYINPDIVVAAVADGLGSERHSKIGSEIAAKVAVEHIAKHYSSTMKADKVKALMNNSFVYAYKAILEKVEAMDENPDEFDTTLCLAIFDGNHLFVGQSGDSGMVALLQDGAYINCCQPQNDEEGHVFPLCSGPDVWEYIEIDKPVCAIMLMTDGIYKRIVNDLIEFDDRIINGHQIEVNVPFAEKLMRRTERTDEEISDLSNSVNQMFINYPKEKIDDDKSLILIFDPDVSADMMPNEYYTPLDYDALHKKAIAAYRKALGYDQNNESNSIENHSSELKAESTDEFFDIKETDDISEELLSDNSENSVAKESKEAPPPLFQKQKKNPKPVDNSTRKNSFSSKAISSVKKSSQKNTKMTKKATVSTGYQRSTEKNKKTWLYDVIVLFLLLLFGIVAFFAGDYIKKYSTVSYISILLICFFSNSTVLLPAPSSLVVIEYSLILNPVLVALCGGLGAALGEMTGFLVGYHSKKIINTNPKYRTTKVITWLKRKFLNHPYLIVFIFSLIPFPVFDIVGIMAGATKLKPSLFFVNTLAGKIIKMLFYVIIAMNIAPLVGKGL